MTRRPLVRSAGGQLASDDESPERRRDVVRVHHLGQAGPPTVSNLRLGLRSDERAFEVGELSKGLGGHPLVLRHGRHRFESGGA